MKGKGKATYLFLQLPQYNIQLGRLLRSLPKTLVKEK